MAGEHDPDISKRLSAYFQKNKDDASASEEQAPDDAEPDASARAAEDEHQASSPRSDSDQAGQSERSDSAVPSQPAAPSNVPSDTSINSTNRDQPSGWDEAASSSREESGSDAVNDDSAAETPSHVALRSLEERFRAATQQGAPGALDPSSASPAELSNAAGASGHAGVEAADVADTAAFDAGAGDAVGKTPEGASEPEAFMASQDRSKLSKMTGPMTLLGPTIGKLFGGKRLPLPSSKFLFNLKDLRESFQSMVKNTNMFLGIDIGSSSVKLVQLLKVGNRWKLVQACVRDIPFEMRAKEAEHDAAVARILSELVGRNGLAGTKTTVGVGGTGVSVNSLFINKVARKELPSFVAAELKKSVSFPLDEAYWTFKVRGEIEDRTGTKLEVISVAAKKSVVDTVVEMLEQTGLHLEGVTTLPMALQNQMRFLEPSEGGDVLAVMEFGARASSVVFFQEGELKFSREIPVGGDHLMQALMRTITTPQGRKDISEAEARTIIRTLGVPRREVQESGVEGVAPTQVAAMLRPVLERLLAELQRSFNYFRQSFKVQSVGRLLLSGGASRLRYFDEFLIANLVGVRVERFNPLNTIDGMADGAVVDENALRDLSPQLTVAFGLAIDCQPKRFNLLPVEVSLQQKINLAKFGLKIAVPLVMVLLLGLYSALNAQTSRYQKLYRNAKLQIAMMDPTIEKIKLYDSMAKTLNERKALLEKAVGRQPLWSGVLKELSLITPEGIVLSEVKMLRGQKPRQVEITGAVFPTYTTVEVEFSQYQIALEESPFFQNVHTISMKRDAYSATPKALFQIVCQLVY